MMSSFELSEWKDYLKWNVIRSASAYLDQEFIDLQFDFYGKTLRGKKELKSIEDRAIEETQVQNWLKLWERFSFPSTFQKKQK